jgi:DNA mismatch repair protein PMS2
MSESEENEQEDGGQADGSFLTTSSPIAMDSSTSSTPAPLLGSRSAPLGSATSARRYIQTTLDTSGAAWNRVLRRGGREQEDNSPPRKKRRSSMAAQSDGDDESGKEDAQDAQMEAGVRGRARVANLVEGAGVRKNTNEKRAGTIGPTRRDELQVKLSAYAMNGIQKPDGDEDVDMDDEEQEEDELSEEDTIPQKTNRADKGKGRAVHGRQNLTGSSLRSDEEVIEVDELMDDTVTEVNTNAGVSTVHCSADKEKSMELTEDTDLTEPAFDEPSDSHQNENAISTYEEFVTRAEIIRSTEGTNVPLRFDLSRISDVWRRLCERVANASGTEQTGPPQVHDTVSAIPKVFSADDDDDEKAAATLSRVIDKKDFGSMDIVGQFNRGFIITRRRKTETDGQGRIMDDLFIIDQHAADEKYNFETLQQTTKINSQRLLK